MSVENRAGREYYYKKYKVGGRVKADYVGPLSNPIVADIAYLDTIDLEVKREKLAQHRAELTELAQLDASIKELIGFNRLMVKAALIAAGYHSHKRQWRKHRER